jgi:hypothetical protein
MRGERRRLFPETSALLRALCAARRLAALANQDASTTPPVYSAKAGFGLCTRPDRDLAWGGGGAAAAKTCDLAFFDDRFAAAAVARSGPVAPGAPGLRGRFKARACIGPTAAAAAAASATTAAAATAAAAAVAAAAAAFGVLGRFEAGSADGASSAGRTAAHWVGEAAGGKGKAGGGGWSVGDGEAAFL